VEERRRKAVDYTVADLIFLDCLFLLQTLDKIEWADLSIGEGGAGLS